MTGPPVWAADLARRFEAALGERLPPVPRDFLSAAAWTLPLMSHSESRLTLARAIGFLDRCGLPRPADPGPDRRLRACLAVVNGAGVLFLDSDDPPDERRFSAAHELAHYLRDIDQARREAAAHLGPAALEVIDGRRPATVAERLRGLLALRPVAPVLHVLARDAGGRPLTEGERRAEREADRLAFELLAPVEMLRGHWRETPDAATIADTLTGVYGLPPGPARRYAEMLVPTEVPPAVGFGRLRA